VVTWIDNVDRTERELTYSIIPRPPITTADPSSSLGVSPFYSDLQFQMLQRMGMKWSRSESPAAFCRWGTIEPVYNQFVWDDAHLQLGTSYGLSTMCTVGTN